MSSYLHIPQELIKLLKVALCERLHVCEIDRVVLLAVGADVLVDKVSFARQYSNTFAVEPILTFIAANVEPWERFGWSQCVILWCRVKLTVPDRTEFDRGRTTLRSFSRARNRDTQSLSFPLKLLQIFRRIRRGTNCCTGHTQCRIYGGEIN